MPTTYDQMVPVIPPRPEKAIPRALLKVYEGLGWTAQFKKNGQYSVVYVSPDKKVSALNRRGEPHKNWSFTEETREPFARLPGKGWWVVCCELMHAKVAGGSKNVHYVHDVIAADGEWLQEHTFAQRYSIAQRAFLKDPAGSEPSHWVLSGGVWLARNHKKDFTDLFDSITSSEDEGLVLKDPCAPLSKSSARWSVKCRHKHKNYSF